MAFHFALVAVAALVWALVYARHGSLLVGGTMFVVVAYVLNHHFFHLGVGPVSLTLGRLLLAGLAVLFLWRWWQGEVQRRPLTGCDWLVALFVGYLTVRYAFTPAAATGIASRCIPRGGASTGRGVNKNWVTAKLSLGRWTKTFISLSYKRNPRPRKMVLNRRQRRR